MGDKIAAVRVIHDHFYSVCSKHYTPEFYVTVDEQMVSFQGGCPVKVYDPSKKNHCFGIKQYHLSDTATYYILAPEIYISGWSPNNKPNYWSGEAIVKRLVRQSQVPRGCGIFGIDSSVPILYVSGLIALNLPILVQLIQPENSCLPT